MGACGSEHAMHPSHREDHQPGQELELLKVFGKGKGLIRCLGNGVIGQHFRRLALRLRLHSNIMSAISPKLGASVTYPGPGEGQVRFLQL